MDLNDAAILRKDHRAIGTSPGQYWSDPNVLAYGTLGWCIREFLAQPVGPRQSYEINMIVQKTRNVHEVGAVLSAEQIIELSRRSDLEPFQQG